MPTRTESRLAALRLQLPELERFVEAAQEQLGPGDPNFDRAAFDLAAVRRMIADLEERRDAREAKRSRELASLREEMERRRAAAGLS